jgi:phosphopantothenate-cysteine ligase
MGEEEKKCVEFFVANLKPKGLERVIERVNAFVEHHGSIEGRKIACVTSGGTTVPLEKNTVRFIDNFSTGARGAGCAESFLIEGYAVIFLHRVGSLLPFSSRASLQSIQADLLQHIDTESPGLNLTGFSTEQAHSIKEDAKLAQRVSRVCCLR